MGSWTIGNVTGWLNATFNGTVIDNASKNVIIDGTLDTTDIALSKIAFATSEYDTSGTYTAGKAIDGFTDTSWVSVIYPTLPQDWTVDLGDLFEIRRIIARQGHLSSIKIDVNKIYVSRDNVTYNLLRDDTPSLTTDTTGGLIIDYYDYCLARYIRITAITKPPSPVNFVGMSRVEIYKNNINSFGNLNASYDSGAGNEIYKIDINAITLPNTSYTVWYSNYGMNTYTQIGGTLNGNNSLTITGQRYQNIDIQIRLSGNTLSTPEITQITLYYNPISGCPPVSCTLQVV